MQKISKLLLITVLFTGLSYLSSCIKEEDFSDIPAIQIDSLKIMSCFYPYDSAGNVHDSLGILSISYTDGDGDIGKPGIANGDTTDPSVFVSLYYLKHDSLIKSQDYEYTIPSLTPPGNNKNIKGVIDVNLLLYFARLKLGSDTVALEAYLIDRAMHKSNVVRTPLWIIK